MEVGSYMTGHGFNHFFFLQSLSNSQLSTVTTRNYAQILTDQLLTQFRNNALSGWLVKIFKRYEKKVLDLPKVAEVFSKTQRECIVMMPGIGKMRKRMMRPLQFQNGQSLVEFVLVAPIMVLILMGSFCFGMGTYQAHMTSDSLQLVLLKAKEMADTPGTVSTGMLLGYINSGGLTGSLSMGNLVDELELDGHLLVARKNYVPLANFIPGFTISVSHAINPSLLMPISEGSATPRPLATPWVPGGAMQPPPWP